MVSIFTEVQMKDLEFSTALHARGFGEEKGTYTHNGPFTTFFDDSGLPIAMQKVDNAASKVIKRWLLFDLKEGKTNAT